MCFWWEGFEAAFGPQRRGRSALELQIAQRTNQPVLALKQKGLLNEGGLRARYK